MSMKWRDFSRFTVESTNGMQRHCLEAVKRCTISGSIPRGDHASLSIASAVSGRVSLTASHAMPYRFGCPPPESLSWSSSSGCHERRLRQSGSDRAFRCRFLPSSWRCTFSVTGRPPPWPSPCCSSAVKKAALKIKIPRKYRPTNGISPVRVKCVMQTFVRYVCVWVVLMLRRMSDAFHLSQMQRARGRDKIIILLASSFVKTLFLPASTQQQVTLNRTWQTLNEKKGSLNKHLKVNEE